MADIAASVVTGYLYRIVGRLPRESQPVEAWFRVTSGTSRIPLGHGETTTIVDPTFEVTVLTEKAIPGLLTVLTRASAEMEQPVRVLPAAHLVEHFPTEDYENAGWKRVPIPSIFEPELLGV